MILETSDLVHVTQHFLRSASAVLCALFADSAVPHTQSISSETAMAAEPLSISRSCDGECGPWMDGGHACPKHITWQTCLWLAGCAQWAMRIYCLKLLFHIMCCGNPNPLHSIQVLTLMYCNRTHAPLPHCVLCVLRSPRK